MSKFTKSTTGESGPAPLDPATMTEDQLRAYVTKLEYALSATATQTKSLESDEWPMDEKRWVDIPRVGSNHVMINGKAMVGRQLIDRHVWNMVCEMHRKAVQSELDRMASRGNLVQPHLLPRDDISSRHQPLTIASLN